VSYALRLADEAGVGLAAFPPEVQEEVLDFLDGLTDEARIASRPPRPSRDEVFEAEVNSGGGRFVVFAVAEFDHRSQMVHVRSVGHVRR
jgi:hypothetical protein